MESSERDEQTVEVHFHALISDQFKFNKDSHSLHIAFENDQLGGWKTLSGEITEISSSKDRLTVRYTEKLPLRLLYMHTKYTYAVKVKKTDQEMWEEYGTADNCKRTLNIPASFKSIDVWHQYDGVIERKSELLPRTVSKWWYSTFTKNAEKTVSAFFLENLKENSHVSPNQIRMLLNGMRNVYFKDAKCWNSLPKFKKFITKQCLSNLEETCKTFKERNHKIVVALCVLIALFDDDILNLEESDATVFCRLLALTADVERRQCPEVDMAIPHFPDKCPSIHSGIEKVVQHIMKYTNDPSWLVLMPWIHILSGKCKPYDDIPMDIKHDASKPKWWGMETFADQINKFKRQTWTKPPKDMLLEIVPLFEMDYLLPRTFMTTLELKDIEELIATEFFPVEACIANLLYHLREIMKTYPKDKEKEQKVATCMEKLLGLIEKADAKGNVTEIQWKIAYQIASHLTDDCVKRLINKCSNVFVWNSVQIFVRCIGMFDKNCQDKASEHMKELETVAERVIGWMSEKIFPFDSLEKERYMKGWNHLFVKDGVTSERITKAWNEKMSADLSDKLQKRLRNNVESMRWFVNYYCKQYDSFVPDMHACLHNIAFKAVEGGFRQNVSQFSDKEKEIFGNLLSKLFIRQWPKYDNGEEGNDYERMKFLLDMSAFPKYLEIYYSVDKHTKILTPDCSSKVQLAILEVETILDSLFTGEIKVQSLELLNDKQNALKDAMTKFPNICNWWKVESTLKQRITEVKAFKDHAKHVACLSTLCQSLSKVDKTGIESVMQRQAEVMSCRVCDLCEVGAEKTVSDAPKPIGLDPASTVVAILSELSSCYESSTFFKLWFDKCKEIGHRCTTLNEVVSLIWNSVNERMDTLTINIKNGEITFDEFEILFGKTFVDDYQKLEDELKKLKLTTVEIDCRITQLKKYRQLETCVRGAKCIEKFVEQHELTGDFQLIQSIAKYEESGLKMKDLNEEVCAACDILRGFTEIKAECLKTFVECKELIIWLKKSTQEFGLKELKVFVDLALMSAGEEPMNIARVKCLHTAVTGYAPLIFDLEQSTGFEELMHLCNIVWRELEANPLLPKQLKDTARHMPWLKKIQMAHGSVEVTSLMQVEACNECGQYTVGRNAWPDPKNVTDSEKRVLQVGEVIKLTVPEIEGKRETRNYSLQSLKDLQSRLMLVAGNSEEGAESVEKFTMIFDGALRLSNIYVKLCSAGCVLFKNWRVYFFCDPKSPVCAILEFGEADSQLKGRQSDKEDLSVMIPKLAGFMETCLQEWMQFIKEKRKKYPHLNYFTTDQLVILQRELMKICPNDEPSPLIYPLLSGVKSSCTKDDLHSAMNEAKTELEREVTKKSENNTETSEEVQEEEEAGGYNEEEFMKELNDNGYSFSLARKAFEAVGGNIEEGIDWCLENMEIESNNDEDQEDEDKEEEVQIPRQFSSFHLTGWNDSDMSMQSMISQQVQRVIQQSGLGSVTLLNDFCCVWRGFLESVSSNIQDFLSLEHLGLILKCLAQKEESLPERTLPPNFKEGEPNLLICQKGEILNTTLSVYMMDNTQPLPRSDEVLMCTVNTTQDEIDIFLRRALFNCGKKIHCLVNADVLRFYVSEAAETYLEEYLLEQRTCGSTYRLLVICGSDLQHRSSLVSFLDKYKRSGIPFKNDMLNKYIKQKLTVNETHEKGDTPAAAVDKDRSSVRVLKSSRAGVGKTLFRNRMEKKLQELNKARNTVSCISIPLHGKTVKMNQVVQRFLEYTHNPGHVSARIFHIDVAHEVQQGVDVLLFNLLILGCLTDSAGFVWRKDNIDLYLIETMPLMIQTSSKQRTDQHYLHQIFSILPDMTCRSPNESLDIYLAGGMNEMDQLFDDKECMSDVFQRPYQYLQRLGAKSKVQSKFDPYMDKGNSLEVLQVILRHCGLQNPSWAELYHFANFLNIQLMSFEENVFVNGPCAGDLPGFPDFVLQFLIHMSRDFSTRSLAISEDTPGLKVNENKTEVDNENEDMAHFQMKRTWESSPHPYLFFNEDKQTFTFLGFHIDEGTRNVIDHQTNRVLATDIMPPTLYQALNINGVPLQENFNTLPREEKIQRLRNVMGIKEKHDPDDTYELTTDNVKKILAIHMRFRCNIPVIVMGETGCGKTRLVKFMCALHIPPCSSTKNMIIMKVHGGTTNKEIVRKVKQAEAIAKENGNMFTVLFFDEANSTESIGLIKEIMCDKSVEGIKLQLCENLKMVAACNPYKKHSDDLIRKLEQAGLGYHVNADETTDRLGRVPMRRLVYRVQPLPQSLLPLVWDFGQMNTEVEKLYIRQMVRRYVENGMLPNKRNLNEVVCDILVESQKYMREQQDECSFVSLRDVERALVVMSWFYQQSQNKRTLFSLMDAKWKEASVVKLSDDLTRSLILALGVCYQSCLKTRSQYCRRVAACFRLPCKLIRSDQIEDEIKCCQDVFLDCVHLEETIARNLALKENVFMMVICIELGIPLFLVGKPGSSKSLAKTIVFDAMQGNAAKYPIFKELKHAQMVSFQCSPLSTPEGIVGTFRQCAQFQEDKDLDTFVSVVVLDEVGLAEDSPRMPLKTLHPLLEDGCQGDEELKSYMKVAFIGISNWALDPAKMNRGIFVQRDVPDCAELKSTAREICKTTKQMDTLVGPLIEPMAASYLDVFEKASKEMREFFGLRDFYSLVKMVYNFAETSNKPLTWHQMLHSIKRNFDGLDKVDAVECFKSRLQNILPDDNKRNANDPDCSSSGLIHACLSDTNNMGSRYLLLITETYGDLSVIQQQILSGEKQNRPITIFGSSFPSDQEYTQVCRNINKIKLCMEAGKTVLLLNLENLYESLYDALNQYYVYFGGDRYVDLGLGTHRVKCPVHKQFRLIVVAEKQTVYKVFPIPLINRLEKHFMNINTMLTNRQQSLVEELKNWTKDFSNERSRNDGHSTGETFIGFHEDACSAVILHVCEKTKAVDSLCENDKEDDEKILKEAKSTLLWCATPDSIFRLKRSCLPLEEQRELSKLYLRIQAHGSIMEYLNQQIVRNKCEQLFCQITTHSKLLGNIQKKDISKACGIESRQILLESLASFDTEQQFTTKIQQHFKRNLESDETKLVIIQCDSAHVNANLIACARFCVMDVFEKIRSKVGKRVHVVFIVHLPRIAGGFFTGFQCGFWQSVHIDDLYKEDANLPSLFEMQDQSVVDLLKNAIKRLENPEDDDEADIGSLLRAKGLILACVPAAMAMVKDIVGNEVRGERRIGLVSKLLYTKDETEESSFFYGVCCIIAKLLSEKEELAKLTHEPDDWMTKEATSSDKISEAGTFRRSCLLVLESKIAPVLAAVIAYLDTNQNLDICAAAIPKWKHALWLNILATPDVLDIKYSDLQSPMQNAQLQEVFVLYTCISKRIFDFKMPFSWRIISQISAVVREATKPGFCDERDLFPRVVNLLKDGPLGEVLNSIKSSDAIIGGVKDYTYDFVLSVYFSTKAEEIQLVCDSLCKKTLQQYEHFDERSLLCALICVHLTYDEMENGLSYFRLVNSVWSECSAKISSLRETDSNNSVFKANDVTLEALVVLVDRLCPVGLDVTKKRNQSKIEDSTKRKEWLQTTQTYRPVFEKALHFLSLQRNKTNVFADEMKNVKCIWERIIVMKLFVEHICLTRDEKTAVKYCMPLWSQLSKLGTDVHMKMIQPINSIETFLRTINSGHVKRLLGDGAKCSQCERNLDAAPIMLPCKDVLCDACFSGLKARKEHVCPTKSCRKRFPDNWVPDRENQMFKEKEITSLKDYQKRCNAFFMDMVSQLCFSENSGPTEEVTEKLLSYIMCETKTSGKQTKVMTIFEAGVDPTPVFRSFLLQLLLKTSKEGVKKNLQKYLDEANEVISEHCKEQTTNKAYTNGERQKVELCLMIIQCYEDMFFKEVKEAEDGIQYAAKALNASKDTILINRLSVDKLCDLAKARMGLTIAANYLSLMTDEGENLAIKPSVESLLKAAKVMCEKPDFLWPKIFLVKCIGRCYGIDTYFKLCSRKDRILDWLAFEDNDKEKVHAVCDRYVVCGEDYIKIRENVTRVALGEDIQILLQLKEGIQLNVQKAVCFDLAIHREVTCSYIFPEDKRMHTDKVKSDMEQLIKDISETRTRNISLKILKNELLPRELQTREALDVSSQGVQCLIVHFLSAFAKLDGNRTLIQPFTCLIMNPGSYKAAYLPTMPQDNLDEFRELILKSVDNDGHENVVAIYKCPNGHMYTFGRCGRPYQESKCIDCGADIGGLGHKLLPSNKVDDTQDETKPGHVLGSPNGRKAIATPERDLKPVMCSCIRLLLHMSLYLGSASSLEDIHSMIKPGIERAEVSLFLWNHIKVDIKTLENVLGKNMDDVLLFVHVVIDEMMKIQLRGNAASATANVLQLSSKQARKEWEAKFARTYLQDIFNQVESVLNTFNKTIATDTRLGEKPLLCMMYETQNADAASENPNMLHMVSRVWRFRTPISLEHLRHEFDIQELTSQKQCEVLKIFLKQECHLRALRFIPSIRLLQNALLKRYQRKLDKAEGNSMPLQQIIKDGVAGPDTKSLIEDFTEAWEVVRTSLKTYLCPTKFGGVVVPEKYCNMRVDGNTPVSMLLPSTSGLGVCSLAMLDFLMRRVQNGFLDKYQKETKTKTNFYGVSPKELTSAHLISYDPQQDLISLIFANCQYTFEMGKGTKIEYDFAGLERQIMDRFLLCKSRIDVGSFLQTEMMVYRTEVTNAAVFEKLTAKIQQTPLSPAVKTHISGEIRSFPDLCESLVNLDIAISFLTSTGGDSQKNVHQFMKDVLQMPTSVASRTAQQECKFQNCKSLWLLLSLIKSKMMADNKKSTMSIFESVDSAFHENLQGGLYETFKGRLKCLSIVRLATFVELMHEYILLHITITEDKNQDNYIDITGKSLRAYMYAYEEQNRDDDDVIATILEIPGEILNKNSVHAWVTAYSVLREKQTGDRRL